MNKFDHLDLDGRLLRLLLTVVEEGSVTRAAARLGVTQSAVSHMLDKLRAITSDPLFVKAGRGIVATARAEAMALEARGLLDDLGRIATAGSFDPARLDATWTIAANDLQRDLLLPALLRRLRTQAPGLSLRVINSGVPTLEMLRDPACRLVISPRPPDGSDIMHQRLFEDRYQVFFDASVRSAPRNLREYLQAEHVTVLYEQPRRLDIDQVLAARGVERRFVATVPGFSGVPPFLRGSALLATLPALLQVDLLRDLASANLPLRTPAMPMYMIWHLRYQHDPSHQWLRRELLAVVKPALRRLP